MAHNNDYRVELAKVDRWAADWTSDAERADHHACILALAHVRLQLNDLVASFRQPTMDLEFEVDQAERLLLERAS